MWMCLRDRAGVVEFDLMTCSLDGEGDWTDGRAPHSRVLEGRSDRRGVTEGSHDSEALPSTASLDIYSIAAQLVRYRVPSFTMPVNAAELTSTFQSASINREPSPTHDIAPSTAADKREPVRISSYHPDLDDADIADDEIPLSVLDSRPRRPALPPLPDMRFEQSYLRSIEQAQGWQGVALITLRDQVC